MAALINFLVAACFGEILIDMSGILDGLRVIDVTRYIAGPVATMLLADLGADVIRIEPPGGGEDRAVWPFKAGFHSGATFSSVTRNKRGITLDLASVKGRSVFDSLLAQSDMVFANLPTSSLKSLGLEYERLIEVRPDVIFVHLTSFGTEGPYRNKLSFDMVAQFMSGLAHLSGERDKPAKFAGPWVDMATGFIGAFGAMAALHHRQATGEGQKVEANLLQTAMTVGNSYLIEQFFNQYNRQGTGNRLQSGGPGDLVKTKDGWVYIVVLGDSMFGRFARMIGKENTLMHDPRFLTNELRGENGALLSAIATEWSQNFTTAEILTILEKAKIPAGPCLTPEQALNDPQVQECYVENVEVEGLSKPMPYISHPARFSKVPGRIRQAAPRVGEHNLEVLLAAGYSHEQIEALKAEGVI